MKKTILYVGSLALIMSACGPEGEKGGGAEGTQTDSTATDEKKEEKSITLVPGEESEEFNEAILELYDPTNETLEPGWNDFQFNVTNYVLGKQTPDADAKMCANSAKGQHIHFIMDNQPYSAHYEPKVTAELSEGNHTLLAFVSRSYHQSIKTPSSFVIRNFKVGNAEGEGTDLTEPHLFYSRPKGTYNGDDTKRIMLDFFVVNTLLSKDGNKVRATINGEEFMIYDWKPYFIEGLPMGKNTIKLELLDAENNLIESPYNPVEREIELTDLQ